MSGCSLSNSNICCAWQVHFAIRPVKALSKILPRGLVHSAGMFLALLFNWYRACSVGGCFGQSILDLSCWQTNETGHDCFTASLPGNQGICCSPRGRRSHVCSLHGSLLSVSWYPLLLLPFRCVLCFSRACCDYLRSAIHFNFKQSLLLLFSLSFNLAMQQTDHVLLLYTNDQHSFFFTNCLPLACFPTSHSTLLKSAPLQIQPPQIVCS